MYFFAVFEIAISALAISILGTIAAIRRSGGRRLIWYSYEFLLLAGYAA